jgi:hypothetical protein
MDEDQTCGSQFHITVPKQRSSSPLIAHSTKWSKESKDSPCDWLCSRILMISAMLGAINLSRAVSDPNLSREIFQQTRDQLIALNKPAKPH